MGLSKISENIQGMGGTTTRIPNKTLGKEDFLNLLIAQMRHQNPLNPLDNAEFSTQLAQFSSLEQLFNVNENLKSLETSQKIGQQSQALNYIGKSVEALSSTVLLSDNSSAELPYSLDSPASSVSIGIYSQDGRLVRIINTGSREAGRHQEKWDGLDSSGTRVPAGLYTLDLLALDAQRNIVPASTFLQGKVTGISMREGQTQVLLGEATVPVTSITRVLAGEESASTSPSTDAFISSYDLP